MANLYEREPDALPGINDLAEREIFPRLRLLGERPAAELKKQKRRFLAIGISAILILAYLIGAADGMFVMVPVLTPFVGGIVYLIYRVSKGPSEDTVHELTDIIPGGIARHLGLSFSATGGKEFAQECMRVGLVGDFDTIQPFAYLEGSLNGINVRCCLVALGEDQTMMMSDFPESSFVGTLYAVEIGEAMAGRTLLMPQLHIGNFLNKYATKFTESGNETFEQVEVGRPEFKKWFAVYASNPDAAKRLLSDEMQNRLVRAVEGVAKTGASATLADGTIYLSILDGKHARLNPKLKPDGPVDSPGPVRAVADSMAEIIMRLKALAGTA